MLTRRQLRIKVMQILFSFQKQKDIEVNELEKLLNTSMTQSFTLFLYMLQLLVKIHEMAVERYDQAGKKMLASDVERNPARHFIDNKVLTTLAASEELKEALKKRKLDPWHLDLKYVEKLYKKIVQDKEYVIYSSTPESSLKADQSFIHYIYKEIIAPDDSILDFLEDKNITWVDDYPLVNSAMIMYLRKVKPSRAVVLPNLVKDAQDSKFAMSLLRKSVLNYDELLDRISGKTPNWEQERIAQIDLTCIIMAQAEFLYMPSIPIKVTMNEYLEISKDYSTPKSSFFINGILENMHKEFKKNDLIHKIGRGLM